MFEVGPALMSSFTPSRWHDRAPQNSIVVVSGLPRSGTSMMMRMLQAGGLEVVSDNLRAADDGNPMGYYEDERVKQLQDGHHQWLDSAIGKAVKVVSPLLEYLPRRHSYKVIFMLREVEEIVASQRRMLLRGGLTADSDAELEALYRRHLTGVESWLASQPNLDSLYLTYRDIIEDARTNAIRISRFSGRQLDHQSMIRVVDQGLYRERRQPPRVKP
jgi:hypothetical protein